MAKKYKCPYCSYSAEREDLIEHVLDNHEQMIPEEYTARRVVYNKVNNIESGVCMVCKRKTKWNEKAGKYAKLCDDPKCKQTLRSNFKNNMIRVRGTTCMLNDSKHQEKMLANRKISGEYIYSTKEKFTYTGQNEKKLLEFEDKFIGIEAKDILMPGPVFEYMYNGEKHTWITDQYLIPWNLVIEVKDGGNNPNTRPMESYRAKQVAKETMITDLGTFNYIRLTNNQFDQLLAILAELKLDMINDVEENRKAIIRIHESAGPAASAIPSVNSCYAISYGYKSNVFSSDNDIEGFAVSPDIISNTLFVASNGRIKKEFFDFLKDRKFSIYKYTGTKSIKEMITAEEVADDHFYKIITESGIVSKDFFDSTPTLRQLVLESIKDITDAITSTIIHQFKEVAGEDEMYFPIRHANIEIVKKDVLGDRTDSDILHDLDGYFVYNKTLNQRSASYPSVKEIPKTIADIIATKNIKEEVM